MNSLKDNENKKFQIRFNVLPESLAGFVRKKSKFLIGTTSIIVLSMVYGLGRKFRKFWFTSFNSLNKGKTFG